MAARDEVYIDIIAETKKSVKSMMKMAAGITAAIVIVKKLYKSMKELEEIYFKQEKAEAMFAAALKATGTEAEVSAKSFFNFSSELQAVTIYGDEAIISATSLLQSLAKLNDQGLKKIVPLMLDFATGMKIDLNTAMSLVGKTLGSTTNALARYGIVIDMSLSKEEKLVQLTEQLQQSFGGMAVAMGDTAYGATVKLSNAIGDYKEQLGRTISVGMKPFREWLTNIVTEATNVKRAINDMVELLDRGDKFEMIDRMAEIREAIEILEKKRDKPITFFTKKQAQLLKDLKNELINLGMQYDVIAMQKDRDYIVAQKAAKIIKEEEELQVKLIKGKADYSAALEKTLTEEEKRRQELELTIAGLQDYINILPRITAADEIQFQNVAALRDVYRELLEEIGKVNEEIKKHLFPELPQAGTPPIAGAGGGGARAIFGTDPGLGIMREITEEFKTQIDLSNTLVAGIGDITSAFGAMFVSQEEGIKKVLESIKNMIATTLEALGQQYLIEAIKLSIPPIPLLGAPAMFAIAGGALAAAGAVRAMGRGGVINEPVYGIGKSGQRYLFGESGPEKFAPVGKGGGGNVYIKVEGSILAERDLEGIALSGLKKLNRGY